MVSAALVPVDLEEAPRAGMPLTMGEGEVRVVQTIPAEMALLGDAGGQLEHLVTGGTLLIALVPPVVAVAAAGTVVELAWLAAAAAEVVTFIQQEQGGSWIKAEHHTCSKMVVMMVECVFSSHPLHAYPQPAHP